MPGIPTPYRHRPLLTSGLDYLVGSKNVFKLPPFKDGTSIRLLRINPVVCFSFLFRAFPSRPSSRLGTRARGTAVHLVPCLVSSLIKSPSHRILFGTTANLAAAILATKHVQ
jgi:hypothetical protein